MNWTIDGESRISFYISNEEGRRIGLAFIGIGDDEGLANARLFSAAPDLLEALVMVRDDDNRLHTLGVSGVCGLTRKKIDAAIKKATEGTT